MDVKIANWWKYEYASIISKKSCAKNEDFSSFEVKKFKLTLREKSIFQVHDICDQTITIGKPNKYLKEFRQRFLKQVVHTTRKTRKFFKKIINRMFRNSCWFVEGFNWSCSSKSQHLNFWAVDGKFIRKTSSRITLTFTATKNSFQKALLFQKIFGQEQLNIEKK